MPVYITLPNSSTAQIDDVQIIDGKVCLTFNDTKTGSGFSASLITDKFMCDSKYFINDTISFSIGDQQYSKYNSEPSVGMVVVLIDQNQEIHTCCLFMSPYSENAVKYVYNNNIVDGLGSFVFDNTTWYYSGTDYSVAGNVPCTGLVKYSSEIDIPYNQEDLITVLNEIHTQNREFLYTQALSNGTVYDDIIAIAEEVI